MHNNAHCVNQVLPVLLIFRNGANNNILYSSTRIHGCYFRQSIAHLTYISHLPQLLLWSIYLNYIPGFSFTISQAGGEMMTSDFVVAIQLYQSESLKSTWLITSLCLEIPPLGKVYLEENLGSWPGLSSVWFLCHMISGIWELIRGTNYKKRGLWLLFGRGVCLWKRKRTERAFRVGVLAVVTVSCLENTLYCSSVFLIPEI